VLSSDINAKIFQDKGHYGCGEWPLCLASLARYFARHPQKLGSKAAQSQLHRLRVYVDNPNEPAPDGVAYEALYPGRHGEGWHNVAERAYGRQAWHNHWAKEEGHKTLTWTDALLTDAGIAQEQAPRYLEDCTVGLASGT